MSGAGYRDHTDPLFLRYKCLKLFDLIKFNKCLTLYKASKNKLPSRLQNLFVLKTNRHSHITRGEFMFHVKYSRTNIRKYAISISGCKVWNSLPLQLKTKHNSVLFKKYLKSFLGQW